MTKKWFALFVAAILVMGALAGCSSAPAEEPAEEPAATEEPAAEAKYEDGMYYAEGEWPEDNAWKSAVVLTVEGGEITDAKWTAINKAAGLEKMEASKAGQYPMVERGNAQAEWHEQAEKAAAFLIEKQDPAAITYADDEGHTDAIAGVSINVSSFFDLAAKALAAGPQEPGPYKDGAYHAEEESFNHGWKGTVDVTVLFGNIASVRWSAVGEEDGGDKFEASMNGEYGMADKASAPWFEQSAAVTAHVLETQDLTPVEYIDDEGHTDAIAGVSIHVNDFYALLEEAMKEAK